MIAIDPGVHEYGWARFEGDRLYRCGVARTNADWRPSECSDGTWICEYPEQRGKKSHVKVSDLIDLALAAGRIVERRKCQFFRPSQWKGQIDKTSHHKAMFAILDSSEHDILEKAAKSCNKDNILDMNDAVCLGLWRLGRLG